MIYVGDVVRVVAHWSTFAGMRGKVTQVTPHLMVLLDGDSQPIRVGEREVVVEPKESVPMTGAE